MTGRSSPEEDKSEEGKGAVSTMPSNSSLVAFISNLGVMASLNKFPGLGWGMCTPLPGTQEHKKATTILLPDFLENQWKQSKVGCTQEGSE